MRLPASVVNSRGHPSIIQPASGFFAVLLGVVVGGLLVAAVEFVSDLIYPPTPGLDPANVEALKAAIANAPVGALLFILLAWALGSFGGGWVAASIARRSPTLHALIVGQS